jgi:hypothetical protein
MAMNPRPRIQDFFSEDWIDKCSFYKDIFHRDRFMQIFWMLRVCPPPSSLPTGVRSRSAKIQNLVDFLDSKFREFYTPGENLSVDESTIGYKGRIVFKCYNPQKPTKWGLRVFVLANSKTGYIFAFEPYFGAPTTDSLDRPELPFTARIVLHLCSKILPSTDNTTGYHIFTDRFYTGVELAMELLKIGYHITGTVI